MSSDGEQKQVRVFISSISANQEVKQQQHRLLQTLEVKRIPFEKKDIAVDPDAKREFRHLMRTSADPRATTPQVFNADRLCGNYESFYWAVEEDRLKVFLLLEESPSKPLQPHQQQQQMTGEQTPVSDTQTTDTAAATLDEATHDDNSSNTCTAPPAPPPLPTPSTIAASNGYTDAPTSDTSDA